MSRGSWPGNFHVLNWVVCLPFFCLVFLLSLLSLNIVTLCINHQTSEHKHNTDSDCKILLATAVGPKKLGCP